MHERTSQSSDALRANEKRRRLWTHDISEAQNKIPYSIIGIKDIFYIYIYIYIYFICIYYRLLSYVPQHSFLPFQLFRIQSSFSSSSSFIDPFLRANNPGCCK
mmetsp:Transcript_16330/g.22900  ORF Transcript_16330/g.22900 Transcript_16330/m.22900 type:complete len:103 (-) Transcript_16330:1741-2049(-)